MWAQAVDNAPSSDDYRVLCALLKAQRQAVGMRQTDLASKLDSNQSFVSKYETGLRRGEALRLSWEDIDLPNARLHVRTAKTDAGVRTITLASDTVRRLRSLRKSQLTDRLEMGEAYNEGDRVLCWPDGTVPDPEILNRHFHKEAGLPRIRRQDLRHTHASHALAAGEAMKVVSEWLGHSTTQITADLHTKVLDEVAVEAAKRIGALYD